MKFFVPKEFDPPTNIPFPKFILRKPIAIQDAKADYEAIMASRNIIHQVRGAPPSGWPQESLQYNDDLVDLSWHQREFEMKTSFTYLIYSSDNTQYLGCIYIMPPDKPWLHTPQGFDADVNMWVTQIAYDNGLYPVIFHGVKKCLADAWPFKNVYYSNKEIPKEVV